MEIFLHFNPKKNNLLISVLHELDHLEKSTKNWLLRLLSKRLRFLKSLNSDSFGDILNRFPHEGKSVTRKICILFDYFLLCCRSAGNKQHVTVAGVTREIINPYLLCNNNTEQCHRVLQRHVCSRAVQGCTWYAHHIPGPVELPLRLRLDP